MYLRNCIEEVIVKIVGKLSLEFKEYKEQLKIRNLVEEVLCDYEITKQEKALVASDIREKIEIYIASKKLEGLSNTTLKSYLYDLNKFASYMYKTVNTITINDLRRYLFEKCNELKATSYNTTITHLKSFFGWLYDEEYICKSPAKKLKPVKVPKRLRKALTDEEAETLRNACKTSRESALVEFIISTGCRLSEVVNADIKDINWHENSLHVIGKGDKERIVYFSTRAKIALKTYLNTREDDNGALFVVSKGNHPRLGGRSIQREIKNITSRIEIDKSVYPHLLRHTFATQKLNAGMTITTLQHVMGHESPVTTHVYAELSEENIKSECRRVS